MKTITVSFRIIHMYMRGWLVAIYVNGVHVQDCGSFGMSSARSLALEMVEKLLVVRAARARGWNVIVERLPFPTLTKGLLRRHGEVA